MAGRSWRSAATTRVDPIGAGDAFNAGYIAVRLRGGPVDEAPPRGRALRGRCHNVAERYRRIPAESLIQSGLSLKPRVSIALTCSSRVEPVRL